MNNEQLITNDAYRYFCRSKNHKELFIIHYSLLLKFLTP